MREETLYELETPYRQKFKIRGFRFGEGEKACAMVAAVLRYLSRVGLLRYHCHSGDPAAAWGMFVNKILAFHRERV